MVGDGRQPPDHPVRAGRMTPTTVIGLPGVGRAAYRRASESRFDATPSEPPSAGRTGELGLMSSPACSPGPLVMLAGYRRDPVRI